MKQLFFFLTFFSWSVGAQVKIGNNPTVVKPGAVLELESTDKALLMPRVASTDAIASPVDGMMIYDTTLHCLRGYQGGKWSGCSFAPANPTSGGSSVISKIESCSIASTGTLTMATPAVATQTIRVTATTAGNYSISTTANGVTFSAVGMLNIGTTNIELTASGLPLSGGTYTFEFNIKPATTCTFTRSFAYVDVQALCANAFTAPAENETITSSTGRVWMDRDLGASRKATAAGDSKAFGCLYQWGRGNDGHASIKWSSPLAGTGVNSTTATKSSTDVAGHNQFITGSGDWRTTANNQLWGMITKTNNPCPDGFRLPTPSEFSAEITAYSMTNNAAAYNSPLKFATYSYRTASGSFQSVTAPQYWTMLNANDSQATSRSFSGGVVSLAKGSGLPVRCIKEYINTQSNGTAEIAWSCVEENTMAYVNASTLPGKTITANVIVPGTYSISTDVVNGMTYALSGTFTTTGSQSVQLQGSGIPQNITATNKLTLNVPTCSFNVNVKGDPSTNGTAKVSAYAFIGTESKVLSGISVVPGIKQRIKATVTKIGSYAIKAEDYGLTFSASGNFNTLGDQEIDLVATGTASGSGIGGFSLNTTPNCNLQVSRYTTANWMSALPDTTNLSQLTIPGTHDAAAQYEFVGIAGTAKCQELTVAQQLDAGVRFLDIRVCDLAQTGGLLRIMHGITDQQLYFYQVRDFIKSFLSTNYNETVIVSIKAESGGCNITDSVLMGKLMDYINEDSGLWNLSNTVSNLGAARGKIVLFSRISGFPLTGIQAPFGDNTTFSIEGPAQLRVQDYYDLGNDGNFPAKWNQFSNLLTEAHADNSNRLYVNFASGGVKNWLGIPNLLTTKDYMNPKIDTFFSSITTATSGKYGTLLLDYITYDLSRKMVKTNFYQFGSN